MGSSKLIEMIVGLNEIETKLKENPENNELLNKIQENAGQGISIIFSETMTSLPRLGLIYRELRAEVPERPASKEDAKEPIEKIEDKQEDELDANEKTLAGLGMTKSLSSDISDSKEDDEYSNIPESEPCPCPINEIDIKDGEVYKMSLQEIKKERL
jgi:hypothetical protein